MARPKRDLKRITINLPVHVLDAIDDYAEKNGLSRTTAIMILCADSLSQSKLDSLKETKPIWDEENERYI